jgi:competence protein ComEC
MEIAATPLADSPTATRTRYRPLVVVCAAASIGVVADRALDSWDLLTTGRWWAAALGLLLAAFAVRGQPMDRLAAPRGWLVLAAVAATAAAWHHCRWNDFARDNLTLLASPAPEPVCLEAVVGGTPRVTPAEAPTALRAVPQGTTTTVEIEVVAVRQGSTWQVSSGQARVRIAGEVPQLHAGDRVILFGKLSTPSPPRNPGQTDWAAVGRGRRQLFEVMCSDPQCVRVKSRAVRPLARGLESVRTACAERLVRHVGPAQAHLALAVVLGAREKLDDATMQSFLATGTVHLLVISGLHVGMLAAIIYRGAAWIGVTRRRRVLLTAAMVVAYALIAGPRPPVLRATVLVLSVLTALTAGRRAAAVNLLAAAGLVVIAYNPTELFRAGTQLSFLSVAALIALGSAAPRRTRPDPLQRLLSQAASWPRRAGQWIGRQLGLMTLASLVVWSVALPLVMYHFHVATPIGVLITPIVWPLVACALAAGLGAIAIGWLLPLVGDALGWVCASSLAATQATVTAAHHLPASHAYGPGPPGWWLVVFYGVAAGLTLAPALRPRAARCLAATALWWLVGAHVATSPGRPPDTLRCTFLSMGHGVCAVLELPAGETILYDAGSLGSPIAASRSIAEYLWYRGISRIDAVLLSHADIDHFNALPRLARMFPLRKVYLARGSFSRPVQDDADAAPRELLQELASYGIPLHALAQGDRVPVTDRNVRMQILHPPTERIVGSDNANSLLVSVEFAGRRILLPGDLESPGLERVISQPPVDCDVLLAPHHGSAGSDPQGFCQWCVPEWTVLSSRRSASELEVTQTYQRLGSEVLSTADRGAITFEVARRAIRVGGYLP